MDQQTRNHLRHAAQAARQRLEQEFQQQLEGTYDILLSGQIGDEPGAHLDDRRRLIRSQLVAAIEHHRHQGMSARQAVAAYLREAAFTFLNRFVALKMLEARKLVQECVSRGEQSSGFQEFGGLAPGLVALPDKGYRLYIECLFDEIGREVKVLFDRRDPAGLLWPRRPALLELLEILNQNTLAGVWDLDETIGWVYQYFNSDDERAAMRRASQAPRNGHELAVRNQFFTPRYVVEFLTDNTLGRTWFEMRRGETRLTEACDYLVRRPDERFLNAGEAPPPGADAAPDDVSQDELRQRPVYNAHRPKKDPRELKILDPACGSGHFLLYAFDLLQVIYAEEWEDEGSPLRADYPERAALDRALPGLILAHNLHGIDIDPRAVQIAALALWMRAQRAYNALGLPRGERPPIQRTNVVTAEPMPGDKALLNEFFTEQQVDERLRPLMRKIIEEMTLAGEAGSLLKIEEAIEAAVVRAAGEYYAEKGVYQVSLFEEDEYRQPIQQTLHFVEDEDVAFWQRAEDELLAHLERYARRAAGAAGVRRRLFAHDAAEGFAFVDLCRERYDVVLMNPPFGSPSKAMKSWLGKAYPRTKNDLYAAFVERGVQGLHRYGLLGAITSRTGFFLSSFQKWREEILLKEAPPTVFADLGHGVLDSAMVEVAAYCLERRDA